MVRPRRNRCNPVQELCNLSRVDAETVKLSGARTVVDGQAISNKGMWTWNRQDIVDSPHHNALLKDLAMRVGERLLAVRHGMQFAEDSAIARQSTVCARRVPRSLP